MVNHSTERFNYQTDDKTKPRYLTIVMAGKNTGKEKLNRTLEFVANVLNEENINDWFIFFGTLLGIVRENSCIQGDDDLDIMIHCDYQHLRNAFEKRGLIFMQGKHGIKNPDTILKSEPTQEFCSFDFYMCENNMGDYLSGWQNVIVKDVQIEKKEWNSVLLNLPNDPIPKLEKMYGGNWRTPLKYTRQYQMEQTKKDSIYNISKRSVI